MGNRGKEPIKLKGREYISAVNINNYEDARLEFETRVDHCEKENLRGHSDVMLIIDVNTAEWLMAIMGEGFIRKENVDFDPLDDSDYEHDDKMATKFSQILDHNL